MGMIKGSTQKVFSIKAKLIFLIVLMVMATVTTVKFYDYTVRVPEIEKEVRNERLLTATLVASRLQTELQQSVVILETSAINTVFATDDTPAILKALQGIKAQNPLFEAAFVADASLTRMNEKGELASLASREYMQQVKATQKTVISQEALLSKSTNNLSIMITTPIKMPGSPERYLGVSVGVAAFQKIIDDQKKSNSTYAFLFDGKNGMIFAHPTKEYIGSLKLINPDEKDKVKVTPALHKIAENAIAGKSGTEIYEFNGIKTVAAYTNIPGTVFGVATRMTYQDAMQPVQKERFSAIVITCIASLIGAILAFIFAKLIATPIINIAKQAEKIATGDFTTADEIMIKSNDEVGQLQKAFKSMGAMLKATMLDIGQSSLRVASFSEELNAGAEQSAHGANQVAKITAEVSAGAGEQTTAVEKTVTLVTQMDTAIANISNHATHVAALSTEALTAATNGGQSVGHAVEQMITITNTVQDTAGVIRELGTASDRVGEIIHTITAIAGQTNLLALNASIEAARAGEQGKGFAVVAEEVRKLAEQSREASDHITQLISNIQHQTKDAIVKMDNSAQEVLAGQNVVLIAGESFTLIEAQIAKVNESIKKITSSAQQLSSSSHNVITAIEVVKDISHGTLSNSQTISSAAAEQSASMQEIFAAAESLATLASQLQENVTKYKF